MRQHAAVPRLCRAARDRCAKELEAVLAADDLVIVLDGGEAICCGQVVVPYGPTDVPYGLLAEQGIGEITFGRGMTGETIGTLLDLLAAASVQAADQDLAAEIVKARLPHIRLRAPTGDQAVRRSTGQRIGWWLLPEPRVAASTQRVVERALAGNLPLAAARMLLADLDDEAAANVPDDSSHHLDSLMQAMLAGGDAAGATWLLEQTPRHRGVTAERCRALRGLARHAFAGDWLSLQLEHGDRLDGLVALAMELGDESFERLTAAAATSGVSLPHWVTSMLPPGE
ncbi:MAG: hypothetical protein KDC98_10180 [Planctomycetes bacterium]|nr:hypothetical protein [Planctomycetota bacterium]